MRIRTILSIALVTGSVCSATAQNRLVELGLSVGTNLYNDFSSPQMPDILVQVDYNILSNFGAGLYYQYGEPYNVYSDYGFGLEYTQQIIGVRPKYRFFSQSRLSLDVALLLHNYKFESNLSFPSNQIPNESSQQAFEDLYKIDQFLVGASMALNLEILSWLSLRAQINHYDIFAQSADQKIIPNPESFNISAPGGSINATGEAVAFIPLHVHGGLVFKFVSRKR